MSDDEKIYLEGRAEAELALAQRGEHPAAVRSHYILAGYYLDRLYGQDNEPSAPLDAEIDVRRRL